MTNTAAWWEDLFEGNLSPGIDRNRLTELENENFLYFDEEVEEEIHLQT